MKIAVFAAALLASACAAGVGVDRDAPILKQDQEVDFDGTYRYGYESANGIAVQEQGVLTNAGHPEEESEAVEGSYSYTAPDGQVIQLSYTADKDGFKPYGAHLPVAPPAPEIPLAIQRSLDYIAAHPQPKERVHNL